MLAAQAPHVGTHGTGRRPCLGPSWPAGVASPPLLCHRRRRPRCSPANGALPGIDAITRNSDADREKGRSFRRTVFHEPEWRDYRSIARYYRNMDGILTSRIVRGLLPPLAYVFASSCLVCWYESLLDAGVLARILPDVPWPELAVSPSGPFSISTFALSLLLVFRTNSSYNRWWEANGAWAAVVTACLQLGRQAVQRLPDVTAEDRLVRAAMQRWLRAFPFVLMCYVREEDGRLPALLDGVLLQHEADMLMASPPPMRPQTVLQVVGSLVGRTSLPPDSKSRMDSNVRDLQAALQGCEKILRTPLPLSYSRHTSRFLVTWLTFLPFCTWRVIGWATIPVDLILGFFLLGIEEIGVQVEEPLSLLALEHWCDVVDGRIRHMEAQHAGIEAMPLEAPPAGLAAQPPLAAPPPAAGEGGRAVAGGTRVPFQAGPGPTQR